MVPVPLSVRLRGNIEKSYEGDFDIAGTRGQSLGLEEFRVDSAPVPNITIRYYAHIRDVGEVPAVHVGEWVGSPGKDLIAFSASLEGPDAHKYILRYFAHLEGTGDTGVHFGGYMCGATDQPRRLEGLKMWLEEVPPVHEARDAYVSCLDQILRQYKGLDKQLASLEANFKSADETLSEAHRNLEARLRDCKISSTASSAASIVGILLLFTPAAPFGAALAVAGTAASVGTTIAQKFFFESDASKAFAAVINSFTSSSESLQDTLAGIEVAKGHLIESLLRFRAALDAHPLPDPATPTRPDLPPSGPGGGGHPGAEPELHHTTNGLSRLAFKGLAFSGVAKAGEGALSAIAIKNAGKLGELIGKTTGRVFGKALPVLGIAIDIASIIDTWTSDNETLKAAEKLRLDIAQSVGAFRDAVRQCQSMMEVLVGSEPLQKSLRKLIKLQHPRPPPGPPSGPGPKKACKLQALMEAMVGVPLLLFASFQEGHHEDETKNVYRTELIPEADMVQLSEMATTAPVVDSVYERYPNLKADQPTDERGAHPQQVMVKVVKITLKAFREKCTFVKFGGQQVYNVNGSSIDHRARSWVKFWKWWVTKSKQAGCGKDKCYIIAENTQPHSYDIVGGHMEKADPHDKSWYILPICTVHNAPHGYYDRGGGFGGPMTTHDNAMAVRIPALF